MLMTHFPFIFPSFSSQAVPVKQCAVSPSKLIANSLTLEKFDVNLFTVLQYQQENQAWKIPHLKHVLLKQ